MKAQTRLLKNLVKICKFSDTAKDLVIVTTVTPWKEVPRIRHQLTKQLVKYCNVIYVELPFVEKISKESETIDKIDDNFFVIRFQKKNKWFLRFWNRVFLLHSLFNQIIVRKIKKVTTDYYQGNKYLINFQFDFPEIMKSNLFKKKIYFCNDDFLVSKGFINRIHTKYEQEVIKSADLCLAVSTSLVSKIEKLNSNVKLFLPGFDFDSSLLEINKILNKRQSNSIRVCYMGFINYRIDFSLLRSLLNNDRFHLHLIGKDETEKELEDLKSKDNFKLSQPMFDQDLFKEMKNADVFIVPYDIKQPGVLAISAPNKLFQYFACGKPVVITRLPNLLTFPDKFVYTSNGSEEFLNAIIKAYDEDNEILMAERIEFANKNTWDIRGKYLLSLLHSD
jgi:glycosyltransferase involved in cell wall biosynthesis